MARNEQLIRQLKLLQLLEVSRFGRTVEELKKDILLDLGITDLSSRTIKRDLDALRSAGFDIQEETLERGKVLKLGGRSLGVEDIPISASEMISLAIGRELLNPLMGTLYWKGIETFWNKLEEAVPEGVYEHFSRHRAVLHVVGTPHKSYERQAGMLKGIHRGILEHRICEIEYQPIGEDLATRRIEPYGLAVYQGSIYVVAAKEDAASPPSPAQGRLRNFKLDRFRAVRPLHEYFKADENVRLTERLGRGIGIFSGPDAIEVHIRLNRYAAGWVGEEPWHESQIIAPEEGGGSFLLTVPCSHVRELVPKVLALGANAEVLGPPEFRDAVAETAERLAAKYR